MRLKVCLIVDNPLRDLDGLALLAWHLACHGAEAWLVPMYDQGFDVFSIKPDWVVANYVRPNNLDLLRLYRRAGIKVGILDTEGAGGKTAEEFAGMVIQSGGADLVDLYCVWGDSQFEALSGKKVFPDGVLRLTGCPRYDYCALPWRVALPRPDAPDRYVLINTNFPVVNPRFSTGSGSEKDAMVSAGFSANFAKQYIQDARAAYRGMLDLCARLLEAFPGQHFVLRPHPFENSKAYADLTSYSNFEVRQEGTSLEWINHALALIHLNCSTAIEASIMECEALSPTWLDTPALHLDGPSSVSRHADNAEDFIELMGKVLSVGTRVSASASIEAARQGIIRNVYHAIDGKAALRVTGAILENPRNLTTSTPQPSIRGRMIHLARQLLGRNLFSRMRRSISNPDIERRRIAKRFNGEDVAKIIDRISIADGRNDRICVAGNRGLSGDSVRVYAADRNSA